MKTFSQLAREHASDWLPREKRRLAAALRRSAAHERAMRIRELDPRELELLAIARQFIREEIAD